METKDYTLTNPRREFLGKLAMGTTALSLSSLFSPFMAEANSGAALAAESNPDEWFTKLKGKHKMVFDVTQPHEIFPFAWPRVFLMTNEKTGTPASECGVVVVLRHSAIGYAMHHSVWEKYRLGEVFEAEDPKTKKPATRNPFWQPQDGDFQVPGVGNVKIGINELQSSGVMFCVCQTAMTVYSNVIAKQTGGDAEAIRKDFENAILPGIQAVPSGVWALGRAQGLGCGYCFAS